MQKDKHNALAKCILTQNYLHSLSVAQLALLFDLLREEGIIEGSSKREIEHFIADNFTSKRRENISQRSLHNKSNEISDNDRKKIGDLLLALYNRVKKN